MSHALLDAYDRADESAVAAALGPGFVLFDDRRLEPRDSVLAKLHKRLARRAPPRMRTYGEEHTSITTNAAVFIGETVEHYPRDGALPCEDGSCVTGDFDDWNTLVWVRDGEAWKAASWQWVTGGVRADRDEWNATYRDRRNFARRPSAFLAEIVKGRRPGDALDVAMGQGRNALYLASEGWKVTGFDISDEALRQAREAAAARKLPVDAVYGDMESWDYGSEKWDLVALIYAGASCDAKKLGAVQAGLRRGGLVVVEGFHKDAAPGLGCATGELAALFQAGFAILRDEVIDEVSDWGNQRAPEKLVRFAAEKR